MLEKIPIKNKDFPNRVIAGKTIIVNIKNGENIVLNESGTVIWQAIDGKKEVKQIISEFLSEFEVSEEKAKKDILEYLYSLEKEKFIYF